MTAHQAIFARVLLPVPHWTITHCSCGYRLTSENPDTEFVQHFAVATLGEAVEPHRQALNAAGYPYGNAPQHTVSPKPGDFTRRAPPVVKLAKRLYSCTYRSVYWDALSDSEMVAWCDVAFEAMVYAKEIAD